MSLTSELTAVDDSHRNQRARDERKALDRVILSLKRTFPDASPLTIERIVDRRYLEFYGAPIRDYIPLLVEREARNDLRAEPARDAPARNSTWMA